MRTETYSARTSRSTVFISDDGKVSIRLVQELEWIDDDGNLQRGHKEPYISLGGRAYSPGDALQILFMLAAALELCQRWAKE